MSGDTCSLVYNDVIPPAPVLNPVVSGSGKVTLSWADVDFQHGYKVHYGTTSGSYSNTIDVGDMTSFTVGGLDNGTPYYFAVTAYNTLRESAYSNESSAAPAGILYAADVDYNAQGQITRLEFGNGNVTTYTYDPLTLRLTNLSTQDPALSTIQDLSYTYDSAGNILSITDAVNTDSQTFEYDALSRLIAAQGSYGSKTYVYDEVGNIVQKDGLSYTYGGAGGPHAVTALSDGTTFGYDANGNMTSKIKGNDTTQYIYDAENRLVEIKLNGATQATYEYDGDGGRTKKVKYAAGQPVETTKFIGSLYEERGSAWTTFIYLGDQKIAANVDGQIVYYHANHLGSTNLVTDTAGALKELIEYDPYGKFSRQEKYGGEEDFAWHYFTSQRFDAESGLYYYGARYYDPGLGRFITADDIVQGPEVDPQTFNRYSYVGNNPVLRVDRDGHFWFIAAIIGAVVGGVSAGIQSDWDVGAVLKGALIGAVTSVVAYGGAQLGLQLARFATVPGGIGPLTAGASFTGQILGGVIGGAAAGAAGTAIAGGDVGQGALAGAITGGVVAAGSQIVNKGAAWLQSKNTSFAEGVRKTATETLQNVESKADILLKLNQKNGIFERLSLFEAFQRSQESIDLFAPISKVHWNRDWIYQVGSLFGALDVNKINNTMTLGPLVVASIGGVGAVAANAGFNLNPMSTLFQAFGAAEVAAATQISEATVAATTAYAASVTAGAMVGTLAGELLPLAPAHTTIPRGSGRVGQQFTYSIF